MKDIVLAICGGLIGVMGIFSMCWSLLIAPSIESILRIKGETSREKRHF